MALKEDGDPVSGDRKMEEEEERPNGGGPHTLARRRLSLLFLHPSDDS